MLSIGKQGIRVLPILVILVGLAKLSFMRFTNSGNSHNPIVNINSVPPYLKTQKGVGGMSRVPSWLILGWNY